MAIFDKNTGIDLRAELKLDNKNISSENYYLAAFEAEKCIGVSKAYQFPLNDNYVFGLMIYNNKETANITFKVYDLDNGIYMDLDQSMEFYSDMRHGNGLNPVILTNSVDTPNEFTISNAYPNPFNPIVNFDIDLNNQTFITASIYNINGQKVSDVYSGYLDAGLNKMSWDAHGYASGIYFINIESNCMLISTQKISLLK